MTDAAHFTRWLTAVVFACLLTIAAAKATAAYDAYLYDSLQRSRDALLGQKDELQRARADALAQIDRLNAKVQRIDAYVRQIDDSLRDVNDSLNRVH